MINTVIIENERPLREYLVGMLEKHFPEIEILKICDNVPDGILAVNTLHPALLFLDTELPPYTAFDLLEQTRSVKTEVILTSSHEKYVAKATGFSILEFIIKPYNLEALQLAIGRYKKIATNLKHARNTGISLPTTTSHVFSKQTVGIPVSGGFDFINVSEIIFCKSEDNSTDFYLKGKQKITANKTLKWVEALMLGHNFFRVHDSYLINLSHIKKYKKGGEGGVVELTESYQAGVSRRRKGLFLKTLSDLKVIIQ